MKRYAVASAIRGVLTLLVVSIIVFSLSRLTGDPMDVLAPDNLAPADREAIEQRWGLDQPVIVQYFNFIANAAVGDFGDSFKYPGESVTSLILERLPKTLQLGLAGLVLTLVIGIPLGVLAAARRGSWYDRIARGLALFGQSAPEFWLAIMLVWVFAVNLRMFPTSGATGFSSIVLPSVVMALFGIAAMLRLFRSSLLETLGTEYVKLARLKGLSRSTVVWKHALKPGAIGPLTFFGGILVRLITGATVVEIVFAWPGVGLLAYESAGARDFPVVQALALMTATAIVVVNILIDLCYAWIDPRVRLGEGARV